jgi:hypothetical protein
MANTNNTGAISNNTAAKTNSTIANNTKSPPIIKDSIPDFVFLICIFY